MSDAIPRLNAALAGRYLVERQLGEGGMATVYLADDLKHGRKVALKVLKPELAAVVGAERFLAEIKTTASLQHPHILPLFDSGEADKLLFYVMPHVEGESLRDRLDREHQLPVDEAVRIAAKVASALQAAHERGVIHRDIKPANILLARGEPLVSDFGIALAVSAGGAGRLTETGLSLGTPHYMSPEQATGDLSVGAATDVWALGCVLYEMLVGHPPYIAGTPQGVLGKIITAEPASAGRERKLVPANVDAAIRRALEKVPADRFASAADFARALGDPAFRHGEVAVGGAAASTHGSWNRLSVGLASLAAALTLALGWSLLRTPPVAEVAAERTSIVLPFELPLAFGWSPGSSLAISPDGTTVVYAADGSSAPLAVRSLDRRTVRELPGTGDGSQPFFSPDGAWVAFFTSNDLMKISLAGGAALTLTEDVAASGTALGTWTDDDEIVFGSVVGGLQRVSAEGGTLEAITTVDESRAERYHTLPDFVPGTRTVLFTVRGEGWDDVRIESVNLDTGARRVVVENGHQPRYLTSGQLLFVRDGTLLAVPFDADRIEPTGPAISVAEEIRTDGAAPGLDGPISQFAVSRTGTLAYVPPPTDAAGRLGVVRPDGTFEGFGPAVTNATTAVPRISPDGRFVAYADGPASESQIYVHDLARGSTDRRTRPGSNLTAEWHPSRNEIAWYAQRETGSGIYLMDPGGAERLLVPRADATQVRNASWSPDGTELAYTRQVGFAHDIWVVSRDDSTSARLLVAQAFSPRFSPDGGWLAYVSNESGRSEVHVRRYPEGETLRVSTDGGFGAAWSPDGRALIFDGLHEGVPKMMRAPIARDGETLTVGTPTPLFDLRARGEDGRYYRYSGSGNGGRKFDVFPDGRGFVMVRMPDTPELEIVLVRNFSEELRRLSAN